MDTENTLSVVDTLALTLRGMDSLDAMQEYLMQNKLVDLEILAAQAAIETPAGTKKGIVDQLIAKLTTDEDANVDSATPDVEGDNAATPDIDQASSGQGVLPEEGSGGGVSIPAKVAAMSPEKLWPEILGWEISQGLSEDTPVYSDDEMREYLAYLWHMGALGRAPKEWARIADFEFRGLAGE